MGMIAIGERHSCEQRNHHCARYIPVNCQKEAKMDGLFVLLFWSGPIGLGAFLALLGVFIWLLAKADEITKRTKAMLKDREVATQK